MQFMYQYRYTSTENLLNSSQGNEYHSVLLIVIDRVLQAVHLTEIVMFTS